MPRTSEAQELAPRIRVALQAHSSSRFPWLQTPSALQQAQMQKSSRLSSLLAICHTMPQWGRRDSWMLWEQPQSTGPRSRQMHPLVC